MASFSQHNGYINVYSEPARRHLPHLFPPRGTGAKEEHHDIIDVMVAARPSYAEDNGAVMTLMKEILTRHGYRTWRRLMVSRLSMSSGTTRGSISHP
jgi:hypothetical protein